ncbi:hypothetical protein A2960_01290 [Candidatus Gottesmanbacteria bacterium RIFCSPLOWO2_01_FULL_39_12b]|uniref:Glycosyltransferase 2-like domain-containing protein n=1 Tax=Candidatus Gottesmanbacteria bacterium RIFCSPLOWO2_01_FULL_39_12b TaxID=1798388 RepID=A0A1F6AR88_9BACT|nr:MAG: hypothetical protein A2960_01290 [Candidatus Gottesmanbacteria bacterium RIFCSPLOWO2_01_FULL_39_12b]
MNEDLISAVVLTKNEEVNIEKCLNSLLWCDEIIVVDDYSKDETLNRIKNLELRIKNIAIKIYERKLGGDFSGQRNFGLEKSNGKWVLFVDADEIISKELSSEVKSQISGLKTETPVGFFIKRKDYFLGNWLNYGETNSIKLLRLGRKGAGKWIDRVHEIWDIKGVVGELKNPILHFPHSSISQFIKKIDLYTDIVAQSWKEEGKKLSWLEILIFPLTKFLQNYFLRLGFLDGVPGLIMALMMSFHSFLARAKYWLKST